MKLVEEQPGSPTIKLLNTSLKSLSADNFQLALDRSRLVETFAGDFNRGIPEMKKVLSIQYMRAGAALAVVLFHATDRLGLGDLGSIGAAGVDVFFIISGFVMWSIASSRETSAASFLWNRITRIVPIYWVYTLLIVVAAISYPAIFPRLQINVEHILLSLFFIPHYSPSDNGIHPIIAVGWTLNYEMFFYAVFAGFLFLSTYWRFMCVLATLATLVGIGILYEGANPLVLTYANPLLLEFAAGVVLGRLCELGWMPGRKSGLMIAALGIMGFALSALLTPSPAYRIVWWGVPAFALVAGLVIFERRGSIGSYRILEKLGDASYSIYLLHPTTIAALACILGLGISQAFPIGFVTISLITATLAGLCSYVWVEARLNGTLRRFGKDFARPARIEINKLVD